MKIFLSGGGTLGPVIPLLAIKDAIKSKYPKAKFIWVGTKNGPEREVVASHNIPFFVMGAGKLRRYISIFNLFDVVKVLIGFIQSIFLIWQEKPDLLISAGGYVSVPLHLAGALLGIKSWVHQQDVKVGLANKLMAPFASKITTVLEDTTRLFNNKSQAEFIGNPGRDLSGSNKSEARRRFNVPVSTPVILAMGGGTGSNSINNLILEALDRIPKEWHVIHLVGKSRPGETARRATNIFPNYQVHTFFNQEMAAAFAAADVVVARAGFATLSELATLSKPAVIVPMYGTHQQDNAQYFEERGGIVMLKNGENNGIKLTEVLKTLIDKQAERSALGKRMHELLPATPKEKIIMIFESII